MMNGTAMITYSPLTLEALRRLNLPLDEHVPVGG